MSNRSGSVKGSVLQSLRQSMESLPKATGGDSSFLSTPPRHSTPLLRSGLLPTKAAKASR